MKRSTEQWVTRLNDKGQNRIQRAFSYVVVLTRIEDDDVQAWRVDYCRNKDEALEKLAKECEHPERYNVKGVWKLYDSVFEAKTEYNNCLKSYLPEEKAKRMQERMEGIKR